MGTECTKFRDVGIVRHLLSLKRVPVRPRNRHRQKPVDLMHGQKLSVVSISVVHHCGPLLRNAQRTKHSARSPRSWAGATPRIALGTETCTKVGSLQPIPVFCPCFKLIVVPCANSSAGFSENPKVNRKVNDRGELCVSCTVHFSVHLGAQALQQAFARLISLGTDINTGLKHFCARFRVNLSSCHAQILLLRAFPKILR